MKIGFKGANTRNISINDEWWRDFLRLWQSEAQGGCGEAYYPGPAALCVSERAETLSKRGMIGKISIHKKTEVVNVYIHNLRLSVIFRTTYITFGFPPVPLQRSTLRWEE